MLSTKSSDVHLFIALASLNSGHNFDVHACYMGMRSSSRPNLVHARPLNLRSAAWRSLLVTNVSNTALRRAPVIRAEVLTVIGRYRVATTTLAHNFIWPCNSFVLNHYVRSFSVLPSLSLKPMRCKLSLCSSYLGASTKVSTAWLTT
jgi:hypothetical protein